MDPITSAVAAEAASKTAAKIVNALFSAFELNMARNALVERVELEVRNGLPLDQVGDFVEKLVAEKLAHMKKP